MSERAPKNNEHFENLNELRNEIEHALPEHAEKAPTRAEQDPSKALAEARQEIAKSTKHEKQHNPVKKLEQEREAAQKPSYGAYNWLVNNFT